jgi:hypothetical protein
VKINQVFQLADNFQKSLGEEGLFQTIDFEKKKRAKRIALDMEFQTFM